MDEPLSPMIGGNGIDGSPVMMKFNLHVAEGSSHQPIAASVSLTGAKGEVLPFREISPGTYQTEFKRIKGQKTRYKLHVTHSDYLPYSSSYYFMGSTLEDPFVSDTVYLDKITVNYNSIFRYKQ
jgi:hypothetical protein